MGISPCLSPASQRSWDHQKVAQLCDMENRLPTTTTSVRSRCYSNLIDFLCQAIEKNMSPRVGEKLQAFHHLEMGFVKG